MTVQKRVDRTEYHVSIAYCSTMFGICSGLSILVRFEGGVSITSVLDEGKDEDEDASVTLSTGVQDPMKSG